MKDTKKFSNLFGVVASLHKSPEWSYEKEWRMLVPMGSSSGNGFNTSMPTPSHVYLGARISTRDEATAVTICRTKTIPVSKMMLSTTRYELEPQPVASLVQQPAASTTALRDPDPETT